MNTFLRRSSALAVAGFGLLLLVICCYERASFPGFASDYGMHGHLVADIVARGLGVFSAELPYHGLLASHFAAALLVKTLGLSVSKAMLAVAYASLLLVFVSLLKISERYDGETKAFLFLSFLFFSVPLFSTMAEGGFYAQIVPIGLYALAIAIPVTTQIPWLHIGLLGLAGLCYPDAFIWVAPALLWPRREAGPLRRLVFIGTCLLALALLVMQIRRIPFEGGGARAWHASAFAAAVLLVLGWWTRALDEHQKNIRRLLWIFAAVTLTGLVWSQVTQGTVLYYARKNLFFLVLAAPLLSLCLASARGLRKSFLLGAWALLLVTASRFLLVDYTVAMQRLFHPRGPVDAWDERCLQQLKASAERAACGHTVYLPAEQRFDRPLVVPHLMVRGAILNSLLGELHTGADEFMVQTPTPTMFMTLGATLEQGARKALPQIDPNRRMGCWIVQEAPAQSLDKCLPPHSGRNAYYLVRGSDF